LLLFFIFASVIIIFHFIDKKLMNGTNTNAPMPVLQSASIPVAQLAQYLATVINKAQSSVQSILDHAKELTDNGGIMPPKWAPFANAIVFRCDIVMIFAGPVLKAICQMIISAIHAAEA
jgi:hypothetical protein